MREYKIYYIGNNKINLSKSDKKDYIFETINLKSIDNFLEKIQFILDECNKSDYKKINYLLCFENLNKDYCDALSKLLDDNKSKIFMGLTIYNKTIDAHVCVEAVLGYKKIVNIFPFDLAIKVCDQKVYDTLLLINRTITVVFDPTAPLKNCYTIYYEKKNKQSGGNTSSNFKRFNFRLMQTNDSNELENTWWFRYYFSIPPCAFGRLSQSSGTCWLNTVLNILFLSEPIADLLVQKYNSLPKDFKTQVEKIMFPSDFFALKIPLKILMWAMVNMFLIKLDKAITLDYNFISVVASKVKSLWVYNNENYFIENNLGIEYGDGLLSYYGLITVCSIYFEENIDYYKLFNKYALLFDENEKINNIYKEYSNLNSNVTDSTLEKLNDLEKLVDIFDGMHKKTQSIVTQMAETNTQISLNWKEITFSDTKLSPGDPPKLLIIPTVNTRQIHQVIYIGDTEYKLIAGGIDFNVIEANASHIVAGLICEDKYYIYDSNNILSYSNWNQGIYNDYIDQLNDYYEVNGYRFEYTNQYVVYIKV